MTHLRLLIPLLAAAWLTVFGGLLIVVGAARAQAPQWLVYPATASGQVHPDLYALDVTSERIFNLTRTPQMGELTPAWSSDGNWLAFTSGDERVQQVCILRIGGAARCFPPVGRWDNHPVWSPDGAWLVFSTAGVENPAEIILMDAQHGESRRLMNGGDYNLQPSWSPDGRQVVGVSAAPLSSQLVIVDTASGTTQALTSNSSSRPSWSPDGVHIAFVSDRDGVQRIYLIEPSGAGERRLTDGGGYELLWNGSWSPDGTQLVYGSDHEGGDFDLYLINADGSNILPLTSNDVMDDVPAWSPDGRYIAYLNIINGETRLNVHELATGTVRSLGDPAYFYYPPVWRP